MFSLRQKLLGGFGGLLAILLLVSGMGIAVLLRYRGALDQFYSENWRSVEYGQYMVDSMAQLNELAKPLAASNQSPSELSSVIAALRDPLKLFDENCKAEDRNITLPGEDKIASDLTVAWSGVDLKGVKQTSENYLEVLKKLQDPATTAADRASAFAQASTPVAATDVTCPRCHQAQL